jgi:hypothetical protein
MGSRSDNSLWMIGGISRLCRMAFVIRADDAGRISWVTPPTERGFPALSDRLNAAIFATYAEAQAVINRLSDPFGRIGVILSIEAAE